MKIFLFCFILVFSEGLLAEASDGSDKAGASTAEGSCFSSEINLSDEDSLKKVLGCYQQEINALKDNQNLPLPAPGNLKEKEGVSVKFTGCKPSKDNKKTICHFNIFSPEGMAIRIPNSSHNQKPYILNAKDISVPATCFLLNDSPRCLGTSVTYKKVDLVKDRPISVTYLHNKLNKKSKAYYINIFFNDEWKDYYFLITDEG